MASPLSDELRAIRETWDAEPPREDALVGLALSGSGNRSAIFNLGVLEALKGVGLLTRIHYLSTVSGGGYIGSWLSANCRRAVQAQEPDWRAPSADWGRSIAHLRRHAADLSPRAGLFNADSWSMAVVWLRNDAFVQPMVFLWVAVVLLTPRLMMPAFARYAELGSWRWLGGAAALLSVVSIAGNQQSTRSELPAPMRANHWRLALACAAVCTALATIYGRWLAFEPFGGPSLTSALALTASIVMAGYSLLPVVVRMYGLVLPDESRPTRVDFSQPAVQAYIVVPLLFIGFSVAATMWAEATHGALATSDSYREVFNAGWRLSPISLSFVFFSLWLMSLCSVRRIDAKSGLAAIVASVACSIALYAVLCGITLWFNYRHDTSPLLSFVVGPPIVLATASMTIVLLIGMLGRQSTADGRRWWSRLMAWLLAYAMAWLVVTGAAAYVPAWTVSAWRYDWRVPSLVVGLGVAVVIGGLVAGHADQLGKAIPVRRRLVILSLLPLLSAYVYFFALLVGVSVGLDFVIASNTPVQDPWNLAPPADLAPFRVAGVMFMVAMAALCLLGYRLDLNEAGLSATYRDRLVRCFLGATRRTVDEGHSPSFTGFGDADDLMLADLADAEGRLAGPLHIINGALNLGRSGDLASHARPTASFVATPFFAGSHYVDSGEMVGFTGARGGMGGDLTLGAAMSLAPPAAGPCPPQSISPAVAFLLTAFNLRPGRWFAHPAFLSRGDAPRFNAPQMFAELFGGINAKSRFVQIDDGQRFESLGVYELVRRRCAVIIASDAESDPDLAFDALGKVVRLCEVDFNASIAIDVGALMPRAGDRWSERQYAVGRIQYADGRLGVLIYLKATMTGDESMPLLQYQRSHPAFPHETGDDPDGIEDRFESYRRLGFEVARRAFEPALSSRAHGQVQPDFWEIARWLQSHTGEQLRPAIQADSVGATYDVFMSYARKDRARVEPLVDLLKQADRTVFWDPDVPAGEAFAEYIKKKIDASRCVVVVWSSDSVASRWVLNEAERGLARGALVPIRIDAVDPPFGFGHLNAVDLSREDSLRTAAPAVVLAAVAKFVDAVVDRGGPQRRPEGAGSPARVDR